MGNQVDSEKKAFIFLFVLSCIAFLAFLWIIWWIPHSGLISLNKYIPWIFGIFAGLCILYCIIGMTVLLLTFTKKRLFYNKKIRGLIVKFIFPMLVGIARIFGMDVDKIRRSFVAINNELVMAEAKKVKPERLLVLLPHCLQYHECGVRIIWDIKRCKRCGRCKIKSLLELAEKYNVPISVATGGTLARKVVKEVRPDAIVAVACERDLTSGIQDVYPIPVYGVLNKRPNGPCFDTDVDLENVKKGIEFFLGYEEGSEKNMSEHIKQAHL